jgi:hypothetical protein
MVVMVEALNCAMSVAVGTELVCQLVPVFQSLLPGTVRQTGAAAPLAMRIRNASRGL